MQDDQINKSVDDLMGQSVGADSTTPQPPAGLSLGSNPSLGAPPTDMPVPGAVSSDDADQSADEEQPAVEDTPISDQSAVETEEAPEPAPSDDSQVGSSDDLTQIKQDALAQLSPIIGELDQAPEEKYRTLMMMIQASDDQTLIKSAYEAANQIDDKKVRAEALLNIINEINYFAGQAQKSQE